MIINTMPGGGGGAKLNVFAQPDEPATKDGLWIATPEKHSVGQITTKDSFIQSGSWSQYLDFSSHLSANRVMQLIKYKNKIFVFTWDFNGHAAVIYVYNLDTSTWTTVAYHSLSSYMNVPYQFFCGLTPANKLYYSVMNISSSSQASPDSRETIVADPDTLEATANSDNATALSHSGYGKTCYDNEYIYSLDEYNTTTQYLRITRYNPVTDTKDTLCYTESTTFGTDDFKAVSLNGKIYMLSYGYAVARVFDLTTKVLSTVSLPFTITDSYFGLCASNNVIYVFQSSILHQYNVITGTDNPVTISLYEPSIAATASTNELFAMGSLHKLYHYYLTSEILVSNILALLRGTVHKYNLIQTSKINIDSYFNNVWWYDTDFREYPTYIGNGTSWTKIKN